MTASIPGVTHHARTRAAERFGRDLSSAEWRALVLDIVDGRSTIIMRQADGSEIRLATVGTIAVKLVWSPSQAVIITVLPDCPAASPAAENARRARMQRATVTGGHWSRGKFRQARTRWEDQP